MSPDEDSPEELARHHKKDDEIVYHSKWEYNRLRYLDIKTGQVTVLYKESRHVHNFAWSKDSRYIACITHDTPARDSSLYHGSAFELIDVQEKTISRMCTFPGPTYGLDWLESYLYFIAGARPEKGNTSRSVYRIDFNRGQQWEAYRFGDHSCADSLRGLAVSPAVKVLDGLSDRLMILSETSDQVLYSTENGISTWNINERLGEKPTLVVVQSSCNMPSEVFSIQEGDVVQLSRHHAVFEGLLSAKAEPFHVTGKDGTSLDGVLIRPSSTEDKIWPTVVALHGRPYGRVNLSFDIPHYHWGPWLAAAGYAILCPNFRGGSSHGEKFASSARGGVGTQDYEDIIASVRAGVDRGFIDKSRVAVCGWSQGGFLSYFATMEPDFHFKAAICGAGVTDWDMLVMSSDYPFYEAELAGGTPWTSKPSNTKVRDASPIWHMKQITTPLLVLHGEKDARIPISQAIAFYRGCLHHKISCEMVFYPREGHFIVERNHRMNILERIEDFFDHHLKGYQRRFIQYSATKDV